MPMAATSVLQDLCLSLGSEFSFLGMGGEGSYDLIPHLI